MKKYLNVGVPLVLLLALAPIHGLAEIEIKLKDGRVFELPVDGDELDAIKVDGQRWAPAGPPAAEAPSAPGPAAATPPAGRVLRVGPLRKIRRPSQAARQARDGDVIEIDAGEYVGDVAVWKANDLILRGVGGRVRLDAGGRSAQGKAIWVVNGDNVTVEGIEFANAKVPDRNGAGIRIHGGDLTVRDCVFRDNEAGILGGNNPDSSILIESSVFAGNGYGDGRSHAVYVGRVKRLTFRYNYVHHSKMGHHVKSRAGANFILYNRLGDEETGNASYAIDMPNGRFALVVGNLLHQGRSAENNGLVHFQAINEQPGAALYAARWRRRSSTTCSWATSTSSRAWARATATSGSIAPIWSPRPSTTSG
jgi:hypothetical protein